MTNPRNTPAGDSGTTLMSTARLDALREVANIGAGHAATALSTLTGTRIMISVPMVNIVPPGDFVPELDQGIEIVAVQMAMDGDITGQTVFLLAIPAGLRLAERMLRRTRGTSPNLGQLEQSALNEAGNILAGAYLTALSEFLDMRLMLSPPRLTHVEELDRKSTRLNSSHVEISYAVFCLKKKKKTKKRKHKAQILEYPNHLRIE